MLKTIIEIISTMADDPNKYRAGLRVKLLSWPNDAVGCNGPAREDKVRAFVRETIGTLLTNSRQIKPQTQRPPWLRQRATTSILSSGNGRCSAFASSHGARIQDALCVPKNFKPGT